METYAINGVLNIGVEKMLLHNLGLVYKSTRGVMTNSIDRDQ
jgi:hypothetical protein